jgi:CDP-diacylglycerol--serine O-phosphatidyltransferase
MLFTMPEKLLYILMMGYALSGPVLYFKNKKKIKHNGLNESSEVDGKTVINADS